MKSMKCLMVLFLPVLFFISSCKDDDSDPVVSSLPVITTNPATSITGDSAKLSAVITSEGQSAVIQRGFCWNTSPNPSVSDNVSEDAFGPGAFSHTISNLNSNTVYYARAYAKNGFGTAYGNEIFFKTKFQIGEAGPGGGIVFYLDGVGGGMEAAPASTEGQADWGCPTTLIGGTLETVGSGYANTNLMTGSCTQALSAATLCTDLVSGGKSDWYLPSKDEINLMYTNLHLQGFGQFGAYRYWSSSEFSSTNAYRHDFMDGASFAANKGIAYRVRAIRSF